MIGHLRYTFCLVLLGTERCKINIHFHPFPITVILRNATHMHHDPSTQKLVSHLYSQPISTMSSKTPCVPHNLGNRLLSISSLNRFTYPISVGYVDVILPESVTRWLIRLLDLFTSIVNHNEDLNQVEVTETEYHQLLEILDDLIHSVGDDENHPLTETMTLVGELIKTRTYAFL